MQPFNLATARDKVLTDVRRCASELQRLSARPIQSVDDGIGMLVDLRRATYEDLNQIQHEYAALRAIEWMVARQIVSSEALWEWNPRQTGTAIEPDVRAVLKGEIVVSGEVTTSPEPKGEIDKRMGVTLAKLSSMQGQRFYFVLSAAMARRARTKTTKAGHMVEVVQL